MADSIPNNVINEASNDLECGICHQVYMKPKILECLHSYCEKCIDDGKKETQSTIVNCPKCRLSTTKIPEKGASALPTNFAIQKKLEIKKKEKLSHPCQDCDQDPAVSYCEECQLDLCSECTKYHKRSQRFSRHQLHNIKDAPIERYFLDNRLCHTHNEYLKYYCEECKVSVCNDCQLSSRHRGHQISLLSEVQKRIKNELSSILEEGESVKTILDGYVECGKSFCQEIKKENEKSIELLNEIFEEVREVLKERQEECIQKIHSESNKASFDKFCGSVDHLKALLRYIKSVGETNNVEINNTLAAQVKCQLTKLGSKNILSAHLQGFKSPTPVQANLGGNWQYLSNQGTQLHARFNQDLSFNLCKRIRTKATNCKENIKKFGRDFQVL